MAEMSDERWENYSGNGRDEWIRQKIDSCSQSFLNQTFDNALLLKMNKCLSGGNIKIYASFISSILSTFDDLRL